MRWQGLGVVAAVLCGFSSSLQGQSWRLSNTVEWLEVYLGTNTPVANPNGMVEPGEGARIVINGAFTPPVGTQVAGVVPGELVTVRGLRSTGLFSLGPVPLEVGMWGSATASAPFAASILDPQEGFILGSSTQEALGGAWLPDPVNPISNLWQTVWIPTSFEPRDVVMRLGGSSIAPSLRAQYGFDPTTGHPRLTWFSIGFGVDEVIIPVVPGPGVAAVAIMVGLVFGARRRRD